MIWRDVNDFRIVRQIDKLGSRDGVGPTLEFAEIPIDPAASVQDFFMMPCGRRLVELHNYVDLARTLLLFELFGYFL
jgi:hypothetical protein